MRTSMLKGSVLLLVVVSVCGSLALLVLPQLQTLKQLQKLQNLKKSVGTQHERFAEQHLPKGIVDQKIRW